MFATQSVSLPPMIELLQKAGFRIRGKRADCAHCNGHSLGTVAFSSELAFCHRCNWKANTATLARELGLFSNDPRMQEAFRRERSRRESQEAVIGAFERWRQARIREVSDRYRALSRTAVLAENVLREFPGCEEAWDVLARFYDAEAQLSGAFDWLTFAKASTWLEEDSTPVEVFTAWRRHAA
jgi:hypothetical protein